MNRRIIFLIAPLVVVALSSSTAAFTIHSLNIQQRSHYGRTVQTTLFEAEEGAVEDSSETADEAPKVAVKCPDCDLCDGSGR